MEAEEAFNALPAGDATMARSRRAFPTGLWLWCGRVDAASGWVLLSWSLVVPLDKRPPVLGACRPDSDARETTPVPPVMVVWDCRQLLLYPLLRTEQALGEVSHTESPHMLCALLSRSKAHMFMEPGMVMAGPDATPTVLCSSLAVVAPIVQELLVRLALSSWTPLPVATWLLVPA